MSREAWGDEGDVANSWEDTAICQEFAAIRQKLLVWTHQFRKEFPNDDFAKDVTALIDAADVVSLQMEGSL